MVAKRTAFGIAAFGVNGKREWMLGFLDQPNLLQLVIA
jgi:hypothetical protein